MKKSEPIEIGRVYYPKLMNTKARSSHRRVVGIHNGMVAYSDGGNVNKFCSEKSFRRAVDATLTSAVLVTVDGDTK